MSFIFSMFLYVTQTFIRGFLIKTLWAWFIAPCFMISYLNLGTAMGISLLVSSLAAWKSYSKEELAELKKYEASDTMMVAFINFIAHCLSMLLVFVFAAIIHRMM